VDQAHAAVLELQEGSVVLDARDRPGDGGADLDLGDLVLLLSARRSG
jgi:hypothetical protein